MSSDVVKKYLLWAGDNYYPCAGLGDYKGSFDTIKEAEEVAQDTYKHPHWNPGSKVYDWYYVVEHDTMEVVAYN